MVKVSSTLAGRSASHEDCSLIVGKALGESLYAVDKLTNGIVQLLPDLTFDGYVRLEPASLLLDRRWMAMWDVFGVLVKLLFFRWLVRA
jgi:hypothetical protein